MENSRAGEVAFKIDSNRLIMTSQIQFCAFKG